MSLHLHTSHHLSAGLSLCLCKALAFPKPIMASQAPASVQTRFWALDSFSKTLSPVTHIVLWNIYYYFPFPRNEKPERKSLSQLPEPIELTRGRGQSPSWEAWSLSLLPCAVSSHRAPASCPRLHACHCCKASLQLTDTIRNSVFCFQSILSLLLLCLPYYIIVCFNINPLADMSL